MRANVDIVNAAREMVVGSRKSTHYDGCWRDHKDCMIVRLADTVERLRGSQFVFTDEQQNALRAAIRELEALPVSRSLHAADVLRGMLEGKK
jgi:ethanolamine utilization cobalamin adenosyltransferase